jgi:hypothetical protein
MLLYFAPPIAMICFGLHTRPEKGADCGAMRCARTDAKNGNAKSVTVRNRISFFAKASRRPGLVIEPVATSVWLMAKRHTR